VARISLRAVSRVLSVLAGALGLQQAPGPQTIRTWVTRLAMVRRHSAPMLQGAARSQAPCAHGLLGRLEVRIALGSGTIVAVLARDAPHPQRTQAAPGLGQVRCLAGSVAASWTGDTRADVLTRLMAGMGPPAADRTDGGSALHKAIAVLDAQGLSRPCMDASSHAVAHRRKRREHDQPTCTPCVSAGGRVSGTRTHTLRACLAPPTVHTKARCMHVPRLVTWAERWRQLSPAGGATAGSPLATGRAGRDAFPGCQALIKHFRADAGPLWACQTRRKTPGLSHHTLAPCAPLLDAIPSQAVRRALTGSLQ